MILVTSTLTKSQLEKMIEYINDFFIIENQDEVNVIFGWDCEIDENEQYKDIKIKSLKIPNFIENSQAKGIFKLGKSDLFIATLDSKFEFQLCHEGDVHFKSTDEKLLKKVREDWEKKHKVYHSEI